MNLRQADFPLFLQPISDARPSGDNIEHEAIFEQINQALESDEDTFADEAWESGARSANWVEVSRLCQQVLKSYSKDLQIACWLTQSQGELYGLKGMSTGIALITGLLTHFWPTLWPQLSDDPDDPTEMRSSRLQWLDRVLSKQLDDLPLSDDGTITLSVWQRVQYFEQRVATNASLKKTLNDEGYFGMESCNNSIRASKPDGLNERIKLVDELNKEVILLSETANQCASVMNDTLRMCRQRLKEIFELLVRFRDVVAPGMYLVESQEPSEPETMDLGGIANSSHLDMRTQAINQLLTVSNYFRQNEPTSPVPYLLERAVRWANMEMAEWLKEMMEDNNSSALQDIMRVIKGREQNNSQEN